ncbi:MAG TPA: hypothetical protein VN829_22165 [Dongiaceae bacterium]|nr:hypothetical protein [Dongiaceae bacterium]
MLIPVFASVPTDLNDAQDAARRLLWYELGRAGLDCRTLGRTDWAGNTTPLREIVGLAKHCAGGLICGFSQFVVHRGTRKGGTPRAANIDATVAFPTPWNQLEAGILFALDLPLLVFREPRAEGGVFDMGSSDLFIHDMPMGKLTRTGRTALREGIRKWAALVYSRYYR